MPAKRNTAHLCAQQCRALAARRVPWSSCWQPHRCGWRRGCLLEKEKNTRSHLPYRYQSVQEVLLLELTSSMLALWMRVHLNRLHSPVLPQTWSDHWQLHRRLRFLHLRQAWPGAQLLHLQLRLQQVRPVLQAGCGGKDAYLHTSRTSVVANTEEVHHSPQPWDGNHTSGTLTPQLTAEPAGWFYYQCFPSDVSVSGTKLLYGRCFSHDHPTICLAHVATAMAIALRVNLQRFEGNVERLLLDLTAETLSVIHRILVTEP